jgi:steroid delta-isomerase-like uncharacterized protein
VSALTEDTQQRTLRVATAFFDAYRRRDVAAMAALCDDDADFRYPAFEVWAKQRVVHGNGKVHAIGRVIWTGLVRAFPDLTNEVTSIRSNVQGTAVAQVLVSGTQAASWGPVANSGKHYEVPHLFVLHVSPDGLIDAIAAYWDNALLYRQLGHAEVD